MAMARLDPTIEDRDVLAERTYLVNEGDDEESFAVKIAFPVATPEGDFVCRAEIGSYRIVRPMRGRDAFEAVFVALKMIGVELTLFADVSNDRITWEHGQETGLRFPTEPDFSLDCIHQP